MSTVSYGYSNTRLPDIAMVLYKVNILKKSKKMFRKSFTELLGATEKFLNFQIIFTPDSIWPINILNTT